MTVCIVKFVAGMKWLRREFVTHLKKCFLECQENCQFFARGIIYENQISSRKQGTIFQQLTKFLDLLSRVFIKNSSSRRNVMLWENTFKGALHLNKK